MEELLSDVIEIEEHEFNHFSMVYRGIPLIPPEKVGEVLRKRLEGTGFVPFVRKEDGKVVVVIVKGRGDVKEKPVLHWVLFGITLFTTLTAGCIWAGVNPFSSPSAFLHGIPFSFTLLFILGSHEFGHYLAARKNGVRASFPFFIPAPHLIGTFGAVIRLRSPIPDRRALIEIGAAGPLTGFIAALPLAYLGMKLSSVMPLPEGGLKIGTPLVFELIGRLVWGDIPEGYDILLHPVAFAAWIGLFITAMNLLPYGQLDGGHIIYALFPRHHRIISSVILFLLLGLGFLWEGWFVWALLLFILRPFHPPPLDLIRDIGKKEKIIGALSLLVFILTFTPAPFP
ncbi:site-2 protease family protein [bacterium]|nr:MAG: site-2 protease family protein [bacterium]